MPRPRPPASFVDYVHRAVVIGLVGIAGWGIWLTGAVYVSRIGSTERIPLENAINRNETMTDVVRTAH
ncbi:hypothetical protein CBS9595_000706 [Malassezia furfur]|nr:hypothetical protein CBS9595_000706 [Malassezia furfur]